MIEVSVSLTPALVALRPPLYFIRHDWEIGDFERSPRNAPEVHYLDHYTRLTYAWQFFWYGLNQPVGYAEAELKRAWLGYTNGKSFITDYKGSDTHTDYVTPSIRDEDMQIKCLFCGGNVVTGKEVKDDKGKWWLYPHFLNAFDGPPTGMTYQSHPWFIHHATNIAGDLPDGTRQVNPFTMLGGRNTGIPIYYPFMGNPNKLTRYPLEWLRKLGANEPIPSPYNPPMR
jgi:hypothetical protein